ncbi:BfmA/BtgA family mobilization protein [Mucilaginibacter sp. 22184]|uniref:BfmA/BtgA family mobilization protein n=1 Tax=Mucilaginibacter sp. 22184 TaxID=3453887 RepID=UPI003F858430
MTKDENVKTIRFPVKTDEKLLSLANKHGLTKLDLFIYMVDYFYKSKKDPRDLNDELLKNAINRKTDNIVAFIKTQEQDLLIPMKKDSERMITVQGKIVDFFNDHILVHNDEQKTAYAEQAKNIAQMSKYLSGLDTAQYDKARLKGKFSEILEHYINSREQMNVLTKQVEKDDLIRHTRSMLRNL